ncbi:phage distal tail protein [Paenibacillus donghaensis]|uniref:Siphovirus-type tail component C-terminal domain-containing protein n=1 Tax=Paenibacillus donghaensis TaxID=414771 RepID=A0A2Z2KIJ8_9BACL|nr:hypothetical protein [Paenibacillus donghaensis]ASA22069.1 hypothetical protein B9T62_15570 [Paenibacillus donghaensis]
MFNRGSFNRIAFNREFSLFVFGSAVLRGEGTLTAGSNIIATGSALLQGDGGLKATFVREIRFTAKMDGEGGLTATFVRERLQQAILHGIGTLKANGSRYHLDEIVFTGSFAPGDRIVIDSKNLTFTKNGANALHMMQGDFFDLNLGSNNIVYTDPATGRNVLVRITHRDKFI